MQPPPTDEEDGASSERREEANGNSQPIGARWAPDMTVPPLPTSRAREATKEMKTRNMRVCGAKAVRLVHVVPERRRRAVTEQPIGVLWTPYGTVPLSQPAYGSAAHCTGLPGPGTQAVRHVHAVRNTGGER